MTYISGFNMPGYMPDSDPSEHDTLAEAKESIKWWIEQYIDCMAEYDEVDKESVKTLQEFDSAAPQECNVYIGDYVYWITQA